MKPISKTCETITSIINDSFIHSGHFYSAPSSPLLLGGTPDYTTDTVSEFHAETHRQLQVKDLPKVPTWQLERESNPRPSRWKSSSQPRHHHIPHMLDNQDLKTLYKFLRSSNNGVYIYTIPFLRVEISNKIWNISFMLSIITLLIESTVG